MSSTSLTVADRPPEDAGQVPGFYAGLLSLLNDEGRDRHGWAGSAIKDIGKSGGIVFLQIVPAEGFATIDDLRAFREAQRKAREGQAPDPEQGRLL